MKIISLFLTLCLTTNLFAATVKSEALEAMIDDYQYFATVDWDQKDKDVMARKSEAFKTDLSALMENNGISKKELIEVLAKKLPDGGEKLKARMNSLPDSLSFEQLMTEVQLMRNDLYKKGASWYGDGEIDWGLVGTIGGLVLAVGLGAWYGYANRVKPTDLYSGKEYVCTSYGYRYDCTYTDSNYGSTNIGTSSCGNVYQCVSGYFK